MMQITMSTDSNPLESDAFWAWYGEFGFSEDLWDLAPQEVEKVLALAQPPDGDECARPGVRSLVAIQSSWLAADTG